LAVFTEGLAFFEKINLATLNKTFYSSQGPCSCCIILSRGFQLADEVAYLQSKQ